MKEDVLECKIR